MRCVLLSLLTLGLALNLNAQRGIGVRFGSDFNHFLRADQFPLEDGWWSQLVFGPYYQAYFDDGGVQVGLNVLYKNNTGKGFPNFPVIQRDYGDDDQNIGVTALEFDLKVGPRFGLFNPKIGALANYSLRREGFLDSGQVAAMNRFFVALPLGLSIEGPTGYGSVGFSAFYTIGLNNVLRNPNPSGLQDYNGSKIRGLRFEFFILFEAGKQAPKIPGPELIEE